MFLWLCRILLATAVTFVLLSVIAYTAFPSRLSEGPSTPTVPLSFPNLELLPRLMSVTHAHLIPSLNT